MPKRGGGKDYYDDYYFPPSTPRRVEGGLKTRNERGAIGETWWSRRWLSVLESFDLGTRLTRGRSYARQGQVLSILVEPGIVKAKVQGSQARPYNVAIKLKAFSAMQWDKVIEAMAGQALFAAKLLAGEMPQNIEEAFTQAGVTLFPASATELETNCSCPDASNPCKHIAAVYYILADQFDADPFLIFKLRGRSKEAIIEALRQTRTQAQPPEPTDAGRAGAALATASAAQVRAAEPLEPVATLEESLENFWQAGPQLSGFVARPAPPRIENALLKRLGEPPLKLGSTGQEMFTLLAKAYLVASATALQKASQD